MRNIQITRDSGWTDHFRSYKILLDQKEVGEIGDGQFKEFEVNPGSYELVLKIDWATSNTVRINLGGDEKVSVSCGSNLRGLKILLVPIYIIFLRRSYLWLRVDDR